MAFFAQIVFLSRPWSRRQVKEKTNTLVLPLPKANSQGACAKRLASWRLGCVRLYSATTAFITARSQACYSFLLAKCSFLQRLVVRRYVRKSLAILRIYVVVGNSLAIHYFRWSVCWISLLNSHTYVPWISGHQDIFLESPWIYLTREAYSDQMDSHS